MTIWKRLLRPRSSSDGPTSLADFEGELWERYRELEAQHEREQNDWEVSSRQANRTADRIFTLIDTILQDPSTVEQLHAIRRGGRTKEARAEASSLLSTNLPFEANSADDLLRHPAVALDGRDVQGARAILLLQSDPIREIEGELDSDGGSLPGGRLGLTRIGGPVLMIGGQSHRPADQVFVLQLDLTLLQPESGASEVLATLAQWPALPPGGLVQVFSHGDRDSTTDADALGGGTTLAFHDEAALADRGPHERASDFRARWLRVTAGFTFRGPDDLTDDEHERLEWLQQEVYRRAGLSDREPIPSRLFGLQLPDSELDEGHREVLHERLPLDDGDQHVLVLQICSEGAPLDEHFGDSGVLEIWMRASDVTAGDFSEVVTFIQSA